MTAMQLSEKLADLYRTRADQLIREWHAEKDLAARELEITPPDGWPGKNAEERTLSKERAFHADETRSKILAIVEDAHPNLLSIEGEIEALEAERRAMEWQIRLRYIEQLERGIPTPWQVAEPSPEPDPIPF